PAPRPGARAASPSRPARLRRSWSPWTLAAALITLALWIPIVMVARGVLTPPGETWAHLARTVLPGYAATSVLLAAGAGLLALALGAGTAWLVTACAFPGRRIFEWAL